MSKMHYIMVLDRSGSMSSIREQTFAGVNKQIESIRENGAREGMEITATLMLFDAGGYNNGSEYNWFQFIYENKPSADLQLLRYEEFVPNGGTPLNDAIAKAVQRAQLINGDVDVQTLVQVFTDGMENQSKEFTREQVMNIVSELEKTEKWTFSFVGAGGIAEVTHTASSYGIQANNVMAYDGSKEGSAKAYAMMAASVTGMSTRMIASGSLRTTQNLYEASENFALVP